MRKFGAALTFFSMVSLLAPAVFPGAAAAAEPPKPSEAEKDEVASAAPAARKRTAEEQKKVIEMRKRAAEKRTDLNGSSWEVTYVTSSDPKLKGKKDQFVFQDGIFKSEAFLKRGFASTNYTITVPPDEKSETAVWETMQTGKDGQIFVRGEWVKDRMSGNITEQLDGGKKVFEHAFTTEARKAIPPRSKEDDKKAPEGAAAGQTSSEPGALVSKETLSKSSQPIKNKEDIESFIPGTLEEAARPD